MSSNPNKISVAGDVDIQEVVIITSKGFAQDISKQVAAIEIYEDMFATFITGKIFVRDSQELTNFLPLVGEEVVRFRVATPSLPDDEIYQGEYFVYKMDDKAKISERESLYVLHFISKEAISDLNKKISRAYKGKVSDIAKELIESQYGLETKKRYNIEETKNETKFISNWWTPVQALTYAADSAYNMDDSPTYTFFENKHGLNFVSFDSLYNGAIKQRFIWDNYTREVSTASGTASRDIQKDYQRILEFETPQTFNYMERLQSGFYGSELITYDILTKQYVHVGYGALFNATKHLNPNPMWTDNVPARTKALMIYGSKYYNNFEDFKDVTNTAFIMKRKALMAQAEGSKLTITVLGRTDYSAGQRVYVELPKNTQIKKTDEQTLDMLLSGNYLIGAICHLITRENHQCVMELIKDSYIVNLNDPNNTFA